TGTVSPTTLPNGDAISVSFTSPGAAGSAGVGSYDIAGSHTFTKGAATNYSVTDATAIGGLTVNPLAVMIMPAGGKSKTYGDPFTAFTGAVSPAILPNGDVISVTYASGGATPTAPVGSYDIVSSHGFSAGSPSNYIVSDGIAASGLTVNRAPLTIIYNGGSQYSDPITT